MDFFFFDCLLLQQKKCNVRASSCWWKSKSMKSRNDWEGWAEYRSLQKSQTKCCLSSDLFVKIRSAVASSAGEPVGSHAKVVSSSSRYPNATLTFAGWWTCSVWCESYIYQQLRIILWQVTLSSSAGPVHTVCIVISTKINFTNVTQNNAVWDVRNSLILNIQGQQLRRVVLWAIRFLRVYSVSRPKFHSRYEKPSVLHRWSAGARLSFNMTWDDNV